MSDLKDIRRHIATKPWRPGFTGKGLVNGRGNVFTWITDEDDGDPTHRQGSRALDVSEAKGMLVIAEDGGFGIHYPGMLEAEDLAWLVEKATAKHPDLFYRQRDEEYGYQDADSL